MKDRQNKQGSFQHQPLCWVFVENLPNDHQKNVCFVLPAPKINKFCKSNFNFLIFQITAKPVSVLALNKENLSTSSLLSPSFQGDPTIFHKGNCLKLEGVVFPQPPQRRLQYRTYIWYTNNFNKLIHYYRYICPPLN